MKRLRSFSLYFPLLLALLWGGFVASPTHAQDKRLVTVPISDAPSYAKRALVIGVDDYTIAHPLIDGANDAHAFADLLKTKFGFEHVTLMTDDQTTPKSLIPTGSNLRHQLRLLLDGIVPDKTELVLFYSGHGTRTHEAASGDADWLVPEDGDPQDIAHSCVNYSEFKSQLDTARPARALLVMDACRDLSIGPGDTKGVVGSGFGSKSLTPLGPQVAELLSCQPTQVSQEGLAADFHQSVFTHYLVKGLEGDPAALAEGTGNVTFDSLKVYVQGQVSQYVSDKFNASQVPDGRATLGGMVLARVAAPVVKPTRTAEQQQQANAQLTGLWTDADGDENQVKAQTMTVPAVRQALDAGAEINAKDKNGMTAVMAASLNGNADVVHLLLDKAADINAKNDLGVTALMLASNSAPIDVVRLLLDKGADVNVKDNDGWTALRFAINNKHDDSAALLRAAGEKE